MSAGTEEAIFGWIFSLRPGALTEALNELELRQEVRAIDEARKLCNWLLGNYSASDFVDSCRKDPARDRIKREKLRSSFIARILLKNSRSALVRADGVEEARVVHPLSLLLKDERVKFNLTKSSGLGLENLTPRRTDSTEHTPLLPQNFECSSSCANADVSQDFNQDGGVRALSTENRSNIFRLDVITPGEPTELLPTNEDGDPGYWSHTSEKSVVTDGEPTVLPPTKNTPTDPRCENIPDGLVQIIKGITDELCELRTSINQTQNEFRRYRDDLVERRNRCSQNLCSEFQDPVSSTRIISDRILRCTEMDGSLTVSGVKQSTHSRNEKSYTCEVCNSPSPIVKNNETVDEVARLRELILTSQQKLEALLQAQQRVAEKSTLGGELNEVRLRTSNRNKPLSRKDVRHIVRRWNLKFNGEAGQDIKYFLTRVYECKNSAGLTDDEVLRSLSELFTGVAATWFRNNRVKWKNWKQFSDAARSWYGTKSFRHKVKVETLNRTQRLDKPVRDCLVKTHSYLRKM